MELNNSVTEYISKALEAGQHEQEAFWSTLTKEQQLMAFCHVIRQVAKAELEDQRSYRGILYDVFGFGPEAYSYARAAGFMDLHNAIPLVPLEYKTDASKPVAWMFQHDETGRITCIDNQQAEWGWQQENPRWNLVCPLYATPQTTPSVSSEGEST